MSTVPSLQMNNGLPIPQLGFGVFLVPPEETKQAVAEALKSGYRLIDTAQGYRNEEGVGAAIAESDVPLEELFITTKLTNSEHGYDSTLTAFDGSMKKLGIDVLDLFLIHWPLPMFDQYVETWRAFEKLLADGRVRSIGVSNFEIPHLQRLLARTVRPRKSYCAGTSSSTASSSPSQSIRTGCERTSTSLISNSMTPIWPRSPRFAPGSVSGPIPAPSRCAKKPPATTRCPRSC